VLLFDAKLRAQKRAGYSLDASLSETRAQVLHRQDGSVLVLETQRGERKIKGVNVATSIEKD
jgi:hypothetical protein